MRSVPLPFLSNITLLWTRAREPGPVSPVKVDSPLPFPWTQRGEIYNPYRYLVWLLHNAPERSETDEDWPESFLPVNAPKEYRILKSNRIPDAISKPGC